MEHQDIFELCKKMARLYGHSKNGLEGSEYMFYADPLGCDFEIHYHNVMAHGVGEMRQSISVFLGGRDIYSQSETTANYGKNYIPGNWEELVEELDKYELHLRSEEPYVLSHSLIELCRREAARNRVFFEKYTKLCVEIAKEDGERKEYEHSVDFVVEREVKGGKIKIEFQESAHSGNEIYLNVGGEKIFVYRWGREDDPHGMLNEKGKITANGAKWKDIWWTFLKSRH